MSEFSTEYLDELIGKPMPGGAVPAIWWVTTDRAQMDAHDRWSADYDAHLNKIKALAESIGLGNSSIRVISYGTSAKKPNKPQSNPVRDTIKTVRGALDNTIKTWAPKPKQQKKSGAAK